MQNRADLLFASRVDALDGDAGRVIGAIIDLREQRLAALLVRAGRPGTDPHIVPAEHLTAAKDKRIRLALSQAEVSALPRLKDNQETVTLSDGVERPFMDAAVYPSTRNLARVSVANPLAERPLLLLRGRQQIQTADGFRGPVTGLLVAPDLALTSLVVRVKRVPAREVIVPAGEINEVEPNGIYLYLAREELFECPDYRPDVDIAADVRRALVADRVLYVVDLEHVDVTVQDGIVHVAGHATNPTTRGRIEHAIRGVRGVLGLDDRLVEDMDLQAAVARAMAQDERLRGEHVRIGVQHGHVILTGWLSSPALCDVVEQAAWGVPGVREVVNEMRVRMAETRQQAVAAR